MALVILYIVVDRAPSPKQHIPLRSKLARCDPLGAALLVSCLVLLFLALEWGGNVLPYSSPQVWGCFLGSGILLGAFSASQAMKKDNGVIPVRLLRQRTVAMCCVFSALYGMANVTHITLLPTYLQTVHGVSATLSGVFQLPTTLSNLASITLTGLAISAWGHYVPFLCSGPLVYLVGAVLFQQLRADSSRAQYIGYQVPVGAGFGIAIHSSMLAVQAVTTPADMAVASVMEVFSGQLGRAVGISVAQSLFVQTLRRGLRRIVPADEAGGFADEGLEGMVEAMGRLDEPLRKEFRQVLNKALTTAFVVPVAATAAAAVVAWFVEWRTIDVTKGKKKPPGQDETSASQPTSEASKEHEEGKEEKILN